MEAKPPDSGLKETEPRKSIVKIGSGKRACPVFEIGKYKTIGGFCYEIIHLPTNLWVSDGYYYLSTARMVAKELSTLGELFLSSDPMQIIKGTQKNVLEYINFYRFKDIKTPQSLEDFIDGPDYADIITRTRDRDVPIGESSEYPAELWEGNLTLAYVPKPGTGSLRGYDIDRLSNCHTSPCQSVGTGDDKGGDEASDRKRLSDGGKGAV